jgi:tetratricopeptide (TPR) repeat protein
MRPSSLPERRRFENTLPGRARRKAILQRLITFIAAALLSSALFAQIDTSAADDMLRAGRYEEAAAAYARFITPSAAPPAALAGLGTALLEMHRPQEAIRYLDGALRQKPDLIEARIALARAFSESGNDVPLVSVLEPVFEHQPGDLRVVRLLTRGLYAGGYYQRALQLIELLPEEGRAEPAIRRIRAVSLVKVGRGSEGETECLRLMEEQSAALDADITLTWVQSLYESGRAAPAMPWAVKFAEQQPKHPIAHLWTARLLDAAGKTDEAIREAELSISLAPDLPFGHSLLLELDRKSRRMEDLRRQADWLREYNDRIGTKPR